MSEFEEEELQKVKVIIDVDQLAKSNVKKIVIPLHRFIEWNVLDINENILRKSEMFNSCLNAEDCKKAKQLNLIYQTRIWELLDDDVKKDLNFDDFVN